MRERLKRVLSIALLAIAIFGAVIGILYLLDDHSSTQSTDYNEQPVSDDDKDKEKKDLPDKIDFQPVIDDWVKQIDGNKSVLVYDLERDEIVGEYNVSENYNTASLYKLFVVYEGYRRVQSGEWKGDDMAGSTGYTISKCLDLAIRESYSPCAETLWAMIGYDELETIIKNDFEITDSDITHLVSNAGDIEKMMKIFYEHKDITDEKLISQMKDSFLNQPPTTYNWRQGLPSGFSKADVYNKVGWEFNPGGGYWNIYHDAAIVDFPGEDRHFLVVVMTNKVPFEKIRDFGTKFEEAFYNNKSI